MSLILDGKKARAHYKKALIERVNELVVARQLTPTLAIIQIGSRADSNSYISAKKKFAVEIGAEVRHIVFSESVTQETLMEKIFALNADQNVQGIILQLPIPLALNKDGLLDAIHPTKDVDGLSSFHTKRLIEGSTGIEGISKIPATARGIRELLAFYDIPLKGKKVVMIGRSSLVGKPTALMCLNENATVTVCHSKTNDIPSITREADIVIVATGTPRHFDKKYFKEGQVVVDVGINAVSNPKVGEPGLVGDVDFETVFPIVQAITPVPGGVGQMTVVALFENLVDSCIL